MSLSEDRESHDFLDENSSCTLAASLLHNCTEALVATHDMHSCGANCGKPHMSARPDHRFSRARNPTAQSDALWEKGRRHTHTDIFMHEIIRGEERPPTHGVQTYVQSQEVPTHSHAEQRWTLDTVWWDVVIHGGWAWRASRYAKAWFRKEAKG